MPTIGALPLPRRTAAIRKRLQNKRIFPRKPRQRLSRLTMKPGAMPIPPIQVIGAGLAGSEAA